MISHALRQRIAAVLVCLGAGAVAAGCGDADLVAPPPTPSMLVSAPLASQQIAAPVYYEPTSPAWNQVLAAMPTARVIVITGPGSGPGTQADPHLARMLDSAHVRGSIGVGYIHVAQGSRTLATMKAEIDRWYAYYPKLDGIFVDEVTGGSDCTAAQGYFKSIRDYVKSKKSGATVIINPGRAVDPCYLEAGDIIVTSEVSFAQYMNEWSNEDRGWETPANAHRIWHIVHTADSTQWKTALDLSRARNAGYVYVTHLSAAPDVNTFGAPPPYFGQMVNNVKAYRGAGAANPALSRWSAWNDGTQVRYRMFFSQPFSTYRVYVDSDQSTATGYAVSGMGADYLVQNATVYAYRGPGWSWTAVGNSGQSTTSVSVSWNFPRALIGESGFPNAAFLSFEAQTKPDPRQNAGIYEHVYSNASGSITGYYAENDGSNVYYRANFAAPFTYPHVFIDTDARTATGYAFNGVGADYMIEGATLYRSTGPGWSWAPVQTVAVTGGATGPRSWRVPRSVLGETAASGEMANIVFNGSGGSPEFSTPVYRHAYSQ